MTTRRWSLRTQITALVVGLLVLFAAVVAVTTYRSLSQAYETQLTARAQALTNLLARAVSDELYFRNRAPSVDAALQSVLKERDVLLVAVANKEGKVFHAARPGFGEAVPQLIAAADDAGASGRAANPRGMDLIVTSSEVSFEARSASGLSGAGPQLDEFGVPISAPEEVQGEARVEQVGRAYVAIGKQTMKAERGRAIGNVVLVTAAAVLLAGLVAFLVTRSVTQPLARMVDFAVAMSRGDYDRVGEMRSGTKEVAELADAFAVMRSGLAKVADQARSIAAGDLSKRVAGAGQLGDAFNAMVESLSKLVGQIKKASIQIASASAQILAASKQAEKGSAEQASSINETTTTMDELLSASKQIASSADAVVKIAERTLAAAKAGEDAVQQGISGMQEIASNNRQTAERILELSERNQQIGNIVDLIDEIADKSDLLALNAAIEGAKAGEAGKGFAVVATEMRALAENVVESTKEIKSLISEIQKASNASVLATEGQMKATERGTQVALKTGEQLQKILQMVEQTTEAAKQISLATQQQRTGTEQVVQSMNEIARIAKSNVSGAGQTTASTVELADLADDLKQAVSQFRLGADGSV